MLTTDDSLKIPRSTIGETYDFICNDLETAAKELPAFVNTDRGRASKEAAYALLMRVALQAASYVDGGKAESKFYDKVINAGKALGLDEE